MDGLEGGEEREGGMVRGEGEGIQSVAHHLFMGYEMFCPLVMFSHFSRPVRLTLFFCVNANISDILS